MKLAGNPNNGNVFKDLNVSKEMSELIIRPVWNNEKEFEIYKARINTMLSTAKVDASLFTEEDYKDLLRGKKVHGVILNKEIFKAFNGPCVNEAFVLNLLGIHIDKRIVKTPKAADIYVGIEHTDNYQKSHSINIGVGAAYGNKPKPKKTTPPSPPENPKEPDGTTTIEDSGSAADN